MSCQAGALTAAHTCTPCAATDGGRMCGLSRPPHPQGHSHQLYSAGRPNRGRQLGYHPTRCAAHCVELTASTLKQSPRPQNRAPPRTQRDTGDTKGPGSQPSRPSLKAQRRPHAESCTPAQREQPMAATAKPHSRTKGETTLSRKLAAPQWPDRKPCTPAALRADDAATPARLVGPAGFFS